MTAPDGRFVAMRAQRGYRGRVLLVHAVRTYPDGLTTGVAWCGARPQSGWAHASGDVTCTRCLATLTE